MTSAIPGLNISSRGGSLRVDDRGNIGEIRLHVARPQQVLVLEGEVLRIVSHAGGEIVRARLDSVQVVPNRTRSIDLNTQVAVLLDDRIVRVLLRELRNAGVALDRHDG